MPAQELAVRAAFWFEGAVSRAEQNPQRHHRLFAQRIDRGIGDLRETLPQVSVDPARRAAERRDRDIVAHRVDGLGSGLRHHVDDEFHVLRAPTVEGVVSSEVLQGFEVDVVPLDGNQHAVGEQSVVMARRGPLFRIGIAQHRSVARVHQQHLSGAQPAALDDVFRRHRHDAGFRGRGDHARPGALPPQRSQAVAIQRRADHDAVAERQRGRAVPRLAKRGMVLVEGAQVGRHVRHRLPRLGHQHHHRVGQVAARQVIPGAPGARARCRGRPSPNPPAR